MLLKTQLHFTRGLLFLLAQIGFCFLWATCQCPCLNLLPNRRVIHLRGQRTHSYSLRALCNHRIPTISSSAGPGKVALWSLGLCLLINFYLNDLIISYYQQTSSFQALLTWKPIREKMRNSHWVLEMARSQHHWHNACLSLCEPETQPNATKSNNSATDLAREEQQDAGELFGTTAGVCGV